MHAMSGVLKALLEDGDVTRVIDKLATFEERQRLVSKMSMLLLMHAIR